MEFLKQLGILTRLLIENSDFLLKEIIPHYWRAGKLVEWPSFSCHNDYGTLPSREKRSRIEAMRGLYCFPSALTITVITISKKRNKQNHWTAPLFYSWSSINKIYLFMLYVA